MNGSSWGLKADMPVGSVAKRCIVTGQVRFDRARNLDRTGVWTQEGVVDPIDPMQKRSSAQWPPQAPMSALGEG
jgi:hypothetical protein